MLKRVTITGIDERTDLTALAELGDRFPFVEWAVLYSRSQMGKKPRYPERAILERIAERFGGPKTPDALAMHLCGSAARDTMAGETGPLSFAWSRGYRRVQVNGFDHEHADPMRALLSEVGQQVYGRSVILQARSRPQAETLQAWLVRTGRTAEILFDMSGGRGISLLDLPADKVARPGRMLRGMGYAGGIGPDNVEQVLEVLGAWVPPEYPFWIDMESGVRTDDWLDLAKVGQVLLRCQRVIETQEVDDEQG